MLELPKNWPGGKLFKLRKSKFWARYFFSIVTFKKIFDIPLFNNLFIFLHNLFISFNWTRVGQRITLPEISLQCVLNKNDLPVWNNLFNIGEWYVVETEFHLVVVYTRSMVKKIYLEDIEWFCEFFDKIQTKFFEESLKKWIFRLFFSTLESRIIVPPDC